jgi:hypothetical protein
MKMKNFRLSNFSKGKFNKPVYQIVYWMDCRAQIKRELYVLIGLLVLFVIFVAIIIQRIQPAFG